MFCPDRVPPVVAPGLRTGGTRGWWSECMNVVGLALGWEVQGSGETQASHLQLCELLLLATRGHQRLGLEALGC